MDRSSFRSSDTWQILIPHLTQIRLALMDDLRGARNWDDHNQIVGQMDMLDRLVGMPEELFPKEGQHEENQKAAQKRERVVLDFDNKN